MSYITGIEIIYNKEDEYYTYKFTKVTADNKNLASVESQTVLSRQFSHWNDCVELLHDKIMCWMDANACVEHWNKADARHRFDRTDYYEGKQ